MIKQNMLKPLFLAILVGLFFLAPEFAQAKQQHAPAPNSPTFEAYLTKEVRHVLVTQPFYTLFDISSTESKEPRLYCLARSSRPDNSNRTRENL